MHRIGPFLLVSSLALAAGAQESRSLFHAPQVVQSISGYRLDRLADIDGDGLPDALGTQYYSGQVGTTWVKLLRNDGTGVFEDFPFGLVTVQHQSASKSNVLEVGDLDDDGRDDWVLVLGSDLYPWLSNGIAAPTALEPIALGEPIDDIVLADFDGDGLDDIGVAASSAYRVVVSSFPWSAAQAVVHVAAKPDGDEVWDVEPMDWNGDGVDDLVALTEDRIETAGLVNGVLRLGPSGAHPLFEGELGAGDIDGDGDDDAVAFGQYVEDFIVTRGYVVARLDSPSQIDFEPIAHGGLAADLADVDGDGDLDGVCCGGGGGGPTFHSQPSWFRISLNDGTGTFANDYMIEGLGAVRLAGATDVDGDGDVDLVAGRCVLFGAGDLGSDPTPSVSSWVEDQPFADLEGDGDLDVFPGLAGVYRNRGDGSFEEIAPLADPPPAGLVVDREVAGDWDGDGDVDLIVRLETAGGVFAGTRLYRNNGGGGFELGPPATGPGEDLHEGTWADGVAADLDGDGDEDLLMRFSSWLDTRIWLNDGEGSFTFAELWSGQLAKRVVDLDGDGLLDVLVAANGVGWRRGLGDAVFAPVSWFPSLVGGDARDDVYGVADFDNDGDLDVFGLQGGTKPVMVENLGGGTFSSLLGLIDDGDSAGSSGSFSWGEDVDGDGKVDLVTWPAKYAKNAVRVFLWEGPGFAWQEPILQVLRPLSSADADGDGDVDFFSHELFRNRRFEGDADGGCLQYGAGNPGTGGMVPTLGAVGPFRLGESPELRLVGAVGGSAALLAVGPAPAELPGFPFASTTTWLDPFAPGLVVVDLPLGGEAGAAGAGGFVLPITVVPALVGTSWYHQAFALDLGAPHFLAASGGLRLTYGD